MKMCIQTGCLVQILLVLFNKGVLEVMLYQEEVVATCQPVCPFYKALFLFFLIDLSHLQYLTLAIRDGN